MARLLTMEQKQQRINDSESCLALFTRNKQDFLRRYDSERNMGFTISLRSQVGSQLIDVRPVKAARSVQKHNSRPTKWWRPYSGMRMV